MNVTKNERRVWVGCLACYNAGFLIGDWMSPAEAVAWQCPEYGPDAPSSRVEVHDETWVMDHEGFAPMLTGEGSPAAFAEADALLSELGDEAGPFMAYCSNLGVEGWADFVDEFHDAFDGEWESRDAFTDDLADRLYDLSNRRDHDPIAMYFDYEAWTRDLFMGDYWSAPAPDGVYVFRNI